MKKIVIIGANNFQMQLIKKAKELGYETHVFAWKEGAVGAKFADFFYPISIVEKDSILEECKKIKPEHRPGRGQWATPVRPLPR